LAISPPGPLSDEHRLDDFQCTSPDLTKWLINRARKNHREGASRCFVVCDDQQNVIGYYALAAGAVSHELAPGSVKRNMPDPIPVAVLGRLAVHTDWVGKGIGQGLLKDAVQRTLQTAQQMGIRVLLCHAIDEAAKAFYVKHGFIESPVDPMAVMLSMAHLNDELRAP
jgi:GNAT superfamily N-acetyltransferase